VLVGAAALIDWVRRMDMKGIHGNNARIGWSELMRFKRTFTGPVPEEREKSFAKAGIDSFHGVARFTDPHSASSWRRGTGRPPHLDCSRSQTAKTEHSRRAIPNHE
jgi:pyruvate/2-oxoglutarate dehydrogenase complex dihydrolipoamide dehydrogenase (E3) component